MVRQAVRERVFLPGNVVLIIAEYGREAGVVVGPNGKQRLDSDVVGQKAVQRIQKRLRDR